MKATEMRKSEEHSTCSPRLGTPRKGLLRPKCKKVDASRRVQWHEDMETQEAGSAVPADAMGGQCLDEIAAPRNELGGCGSREGALRQDFTSAVNGQGHGHESAAAGVGPMEMLPSQRGGGWEARPSQRDVLRRESWSGGGSLGGRGGDSMYTNVQWRGGGAALWKKNGQGHGLGAGGGGVKSGGWMLGGDQAGGLHYQARPAQFFGGPPPSSTLSGQQRVATGDDYDRSTQVEQGQQGQTDQWGGAVGRQQQQQQSMSISRSTGFQGLGNTPASYADSRGVLEHTDHQGEGWGNDDVATPEGNGGGGRGIGGIVVKGRTEEMVGFQHQQQTGMDGRCNSNGIHPGARRSVLGSMNKNNNAHHSLGVSAGESSNPMVHPPVRNEGFDLVRPVTSSQKMRGLSFASVSRGHVWKGQHHHSVMHPHRLGGQSLYGGAEAAAFKAGTLAAKGDNQNSSSSSSNNNNKNNHNNNNNNNNDGGSNMYSDKSNGGGENEVTQNIGSRVAMGRWGGYGGGSRPFTAQAESAARPWRGGSFVVGAFVGRNPSQNPSGSRVMRVPSHAGTGYSSNSAGRGIL